MAEPGRRDERQEPPRRPSAPPTPPHGVVSGWSDAGPPPGDPWRAGRGGERFDPAGHGQGAAGGGDYGWGEDVDPGRDQGGPPSRGFDGPATDPEPTPGLPARRDTAPVRRTRGVTDPDLAHDPNDPTMPPLTPSRWMTVYAIAVTGVLTAGLVFSGGLELQLVAAIVLVMQIGVVVVYSLLRHAASRPVAIGVGIAASVAADAIAVYTQPLRLDYLAFVVAGVFFATIVGQLARRRGRRDLTDAMSAGVYIAVIAVGMSTLIGLARHAGGGQALAIGAVAVGAGVVAARAIDITMPKPRINRQVPRGAFGVVIGAMVGTAMAAYTGVLLDGITAQKAAVGGIAIALVGVVGDLSAGYAHAGRRIAAEGEAPWPIQHGLGPLLAFGTAAPVLYLLSVFYLVRAY